MKPTKRRLFFTFLLGIIVGFCLWLLLFGHRPRPIGVTVTEDPGYARAKLAESEHHYQDRIDSLDQVNSNLQLTVNKRQTPLRHAKKQDPSLQRTLKDHLTDHYTHTHPVTQ